MASSVDATLNAIRSVVGISKYTIVKLGTLEDATVIQNIMSGITDIDIANELVLAYLKSGGYLEYKIKSTIARNMYYNVEPYGYCATLSAARLIVPGKKLELKLEADRSELIDLMQAYMLKEAIPEAEKEKIRRQCESLKELGNGNLQKSPTIGSDHWLTNSIWDEHHFLKSVVKVAMWSAVGDDQKNGSEDFFQYFSTNQGTDAIDHKFYRLYEDHVDKITNYKHLMFHSSHFYFLDTDVEDLLDHFQNAVKDLASNLIKYLKQADTKIV